MNNSSDRGTDNCLLHLISLKFSLFRLQNWQTFSSNRTNIQNMEKYNEELQI